MNRSLLLAAAAGIAGYIALAALSGRVPPVPSKGFRMDHDAAIRRARDIGKEFGVDAIVWQSGAMSFQDRRLQFWLNRNASGPIDRLITPLTTRVGLATPSGAESVFITLNAEGGLVSFRRKGAAPLKTPLANPSETAWRAFQTIAGAHAPEFHLVTDGAPAPGETQYVWEADSTRPEQLNWSIKVSMGGEGVREATLAANLSRRASEPYIRMKSLEDAIGGIGAVGAFGFICAAAALFIYGWFRGTVERGAAIGAGLVYFLSVVITNVVGSGSQRFLVDDIDRFSLLNLVLEIVLLALAGTVLVGAGEGLSTAAGRDRWFSLIVLLRGGLSSRRVGSSLAAGILLGVVLAALGPVAALAPGADFEWSQPALESLSSPAPWLEPLLPPVSVGWLVLFCLLVPLLENRLARVPGHGVLVCLAAMIGCVAFSPFEPGPVPSFVWAVLFGGVCFLIYRGWDLLALFAALCSFRVLEQSLALLGAGSESLHFSAHLGLFVLAAGCLAAGLVAWRGREVALQLVSAAPAPVSQREKLKSEFSEARQAQMRMLPTKPPPIDGFELAALCHPAREVGGDLYDYPRLPDGRHVICVADVSGKGMSAALYMTLTKGVLTAAVQDSDDLAEIASQLNTHIYAAGRRRIFVTAALGALDPGSRVLEYARAGHNPIVWHSPLRGFTRLVQPRGLGLGVGPAPIFNRTLELERMQLEPGDVVVFYSDGVTEAMNEDLEQFGEERLLASVDGAGSLPAEQVRQRILDDLTAFLQGLSPQDDATIVVLRAAAPVSGVAQAATLGDNSSQSGDGTLG